MAFIQLICFKIRTSGIKVSSMFKKTTQKSMNKLVSLTPHTFPLVWCG